MTLLSLALILSCLPSALLDFALPKWTADPDIRIEDTYKLLYQATRGGEHMVPSRAVAEDWLEKEWQSVGSAKTNEPLWEPLCPDGKVGRLNIRPYKKRGGNLADLVDAFVASSKAYRSEPDSFLRVWFELGKRLKDRSDDQRLNHANWLRLDAEMKAKDYPAIRHSKHFSSARHPAYRVLIAAEAQRFLGKD